MQQCSPPVCTRSGPPKVCTCAAQKKIFRQPFFMKKNFGDPFFRDGLFFLLFSLHVCWKSFLVFLFLWISDWRCFDRRCRTFPFCVWVSSYLSHLFSFCVFSL